jgi:hypothetical protein
MKQPDGSQKQRRHLWPATYPSIHHRARQRCFSKDFAMTNAEQVHPTPVVLTRRENLKRGAAALVQRRNKASSTMTAAVSPARAEPPRGKNP